MDKRQEILPRVERPGRYLGGEVGQVLKDPSRLRLTFALAFPEVYEIAMSHLGLKVLYGLVAERPDVAAERVFAPWVDLMDLLEREGQPPWSLETGRPLGKFDVVGFSLQYELTYTNMLQMLRLAGVPLRREERGPAHPLVIAGGPCMVNPEPVADFLDLAVVGEAEELLDPLLDLFIVAKEQGWERKRLYAEAVKLEGVYAPSLYTPRYEDGRLLSIEAAPGAPAKVKRRVADDFPWIAPPLRPVLPAVTPVHDRFGLEVARGCTRGCRFCQAGIIYRPVREREPDDIYQQAMDGLCATGLEELALLSLSTGDYSHIEELTAGLMDAMAGRRVSLSLPSLRVESLSEGLINQIKRVRKTGFTIAPEAGSERLRRVINKNLSEAAILETAERVFRLSWNLVKLYFMVGLPTETDEDLVAIGGLCRAVVGKSRSAGKGKGRRPSVNASLGVFVPKPHTPFQWEAQVDLEEGRRRLHLAKTELRDRKVQAKWNAVTLSLMEGVFSRGDRRLSAVLELAVAKGCRFDGWSEQFNLQNWLDSLSETGLSPEIFLRARDLEEVLPWDHIDVGVSRGFLLRERERALAEESTGDCRTGPCQDCGVCDFSDRLTRLAVGPFSPPPPPPVPGGEPVYYRFRLEKMGPARFLGHLEMISQLMRGFRRAGYDLAHSEGFNPHPKLKVDSALPLGVESLVENLEVGLLNGADLDEIAQKVNDSLPDGLRIADGRRSRPGEKLPEPDLVTYRVESPADLEQEILDGFMAAEVFLYNRQTPKGDREIDMKGALKELSLEGKRLLMAVVGKAGGRPKPSEILQAVFGLNQEDALAARVVKIKAS